MLATTEYKLIPTHGKLYNDKKLRVTRCLRLSLSLSLYIYIKRERERERETERGRERERVKERLEY